MGFPNKRLSVILALSVAAVAMSGCTRIRTHQGYLVDNLLVDSIQPGVDNRASVEGTLGRPTFADQFGEQDWYYVARDMKQLAFANPKVAKQEIIRVQFDPTGNVTSIDKRDASAIVKVSPKDGATPTLGRHRTLFQEIFGNIGAVGAAGAGGAPGSGTAN